MHEPVFFLFEDFFTSVAGRWQCQTLKYELFLKVLDAICLISRSTLLSIVHNTHRFMRVVSIMIAEKKIDHEHRIVISFI